MNTDLADKVVEAIRTHPDEHDQDKWGVKSACGTKMCAAGWAVTLEGAELIWEKGSYSSDPTVLVAYDCNFNGQVRDIESLARDLLDLNYDQGELVFYESANSADGVQASFDAIANGYDGYSNEL